MKILFLSDDFPPQSHGGADRVAFGLAQEMQAQGHEVFVITATQEKKLAGEIEHEGLKLFRIYANFHERWTAYLGLYNPQTVGAVKKIISEIRPDVIHAHNIHRFLSYQCLKIGKKYGAKVFLTAHDAMSFHYGKVPGGNFKISPWKQFKKFKKRYNPFRNIIIRCYLKRYVDKIFSVSDELKKALEVNKIKNIIVIHNGIDARKWLRTEEAVDDFKNKFNLNGKKVVLFGGRLSEPKGGEKIIQVMQKVVAEVPEAVLLVLGKIDNYSNKMMGLANELGIKEHVVFTGWISGEELVAGYYVSDVVAVLSLYLDPFPTVNLEAMICSKPVVGTCWGGTKEIVKDGITGFLVDPFNAEEVAEKIATLLKDKKKAEMFGSAGRDWVMKNFTLSAQAEKVLRHY